MKKFRGKKRYFRNLWSKVTVEATIERYDQDLDFGNESWFDIWHTHLDFFGIGNISLKLRKEHIKAHLALYRNILIKLDSLEKPYQSWILLNDQDAGLDAVYIHTPNPNSDNFPLKIDNIVWNCNIPKFLSNVLNPKELNVGYKMWELSSGYIIQAKNKGIKL